MGAWGVCLFFFIEHEQDSCFFQLCCSLIDLTVPLFTREDRAVANATTKKVNEQDAERFQNVMLVGMASDISKKSSVWIAQDTMESSVL